MKILYYENLEPYGSSILLLHCWTTIYSIAVWFKATVQYVGFKNSAHILILLPWFLINLIPFLQYLIIYRICGLLIWWWFSFCGLVNFVRIAKLNVHHYHACTASICFFPYSTLKTVNLEYRH